MITTFDAKIRWAFSQVFSEKNGAVYIDMLTEILQLIATPIGMAATAGALLVLLFIVRLFIGKPRHARFSLLRFVFLVATTLLVAVAMLLLLIFISTTMYVLMQ